MALSIETRNGKRFMVEADSALIGRDSTCQIALPDETNLQPIHAKIRKVADRWMIEAQGDWQIQVGTGLPGRMSWLKPGDIIRLTESGPEITFGEVQPTFKSSEERVSQKSQASAPISEPPNERFTEKPRPSGNTPTTPPDLPASVEEWFYAKDGTKCGPFSPTQLKQLAGAGVLRPEDLVWKTGMAKWIPASSIPALFPSGPPVQSPAVPPPVQPPPVPPPVSTADWFYAKNGQKVGPFTEEQLKQMVVTGEVKATDMVWKTGMPTWVIAGSVWNAPQHTPPPMPRTPAPQTPKTQVNPPKDQPSATILPSNPPKDPILMAVLSFFIPWLGQILIGQVTKGIVMLLVTPVLFALFVIATLGMGLVVLPFVGLIAVIDAYLLAKKLRDGQAIGTWEFFGIESAPSLAMPDLLPKADSGGKPVVPVKLRPPGLVGSAIGMLFVSGLAMMISLLGVVGIVVNERMPAVMQILIALSFIHNAWVIFAVVQMLRMQRYAFAITAPLLVIASWCWLTFSGIPIGMSVMGILGGISVGVWSLGVLRRPEVRAAFANQYDPLEALLPMAKATIEGQSSNLGAIKGLFKQLLTSKIALGIAGVVLLCLLAVPLFSLFGPSQHKSKFLGADPKADIADSPRAKNKNGRAEKKGNREEDYTSKLPPSEAKTLVKRYIELSRSAPDEDEQKEMSQLLNTLVSHGAKAAPVTVALAKRYVELSESAPDEAEQKEMAEILNALGRLGVHAKSASAVLTARYNELSESAPDETERREMKMILETTSRMR